MLVVVIKQSAQNSLARVENKTFIAAAITALLFGIHPQHVESVVWVAERKDVLCLFFILLALLSYVFYCRARSALWYLSTLLCFMLALLAKPMAVTFPAILLLMDVYPLKRTPLIHSSQQVSYKILAIEKIPFFVLTLFSIIFTILAQAHGGAFTTLDNLGMQSRLLNAFNSLIFYLSKFLFPVGLSPFYPFSSQGDYLIPILACFLITFICGYFWYKKKYYWLMAWLFYLVTLSPVIGIIQVGSQAAADRYTYLPTIPFYMLIGIGIVKLLYTEKKIIKLGTVIVFLLVSFVLVQLTQKQIMVWKNELTFWSYIVTYAPKNERAHMMLGEVYSRIGESEKAAMHYHLGKKWYKRLLVAYIESNQLQKARSMLEQLLKENIVGYSLDHIYYLMGEIDFRQGHLYKAQESLTKALEINSKNKQAKELLLGINSILGAVTK